MALVLLDRAQQQGTANTTVSFTLTTSVNGFQSLAGIGNGNTTYYAGTDLSGNWEAGVGTYSTGGTLARTTILTSSNAGSAVTFVGTVNVFVTYPSGKSVNLDVSGNVSPLGTVASGTWQGSTVGVAYGGTGVTASSGANSVVLRDANQNIVANNVFAGYTSTISSGTTIVLTAASTQYQRITGTATQTIQLPDATTLPSGFIFYIDNDSSLSATVIDNASTSLDIIASGGVNQWVLLSNITTAGTWIAYGLTPSAVNWGTNTLDLASTVVSNGTWQGGTIASGYGGTGLTTFVAANNALYSTSAGALAAGTLPVLAGGTGVTTSTGSGAVVLSAGPTFTGTLNAANISYTGTLTGGTGVIAIGTNQIYKDASGNVGIGTSSPAYKLDVVGVVAASTGFYMPINQAIFSSRASDGASVNMLRMLTGTNTTVLTGGYGALASTALSFQNVAGTELMAIQGSGDVGIGNTPSGTYKLEVTGSVGVTATVTAAELIASNGLVLNNKTIATTYTFPTGYNASSVGPVTINSGVVITVPSTQRWVVL